MTNKDFIKLLLISICCDKKYEIDSSRTDDGSICYEVTGEGDDENQSIHFDGFVVYEVILSFLNCIKEDPDLLNKLNYTINHLSQKSLLDDDIRNSVYEHKNKFVDGFSKKYNLDKLVYFEGTDNIESAIQREKYLVMQWIY